MRCGFLKNARANIISIGCSIFPSGLGCSLWQELWKARFTWSLSPIQQSQSEKVLMPTERTWQQWLERLYNLRRDKRGSHERPHKPVLLLSILDLLERGQVKQNEITLSPDLV